MDHDEMQLSFNEDPADSQFSSRVHKNEVVVKLAEIPSVK